MKIVCKIIEGKNKKNLVWIALSYLNVCNATSSLFQIAGVVFEHSLHCCIIFFIKPVAILGAAMQ